MNRGFASIGLAIILVALLAIGGGGYWIMTQESHISIIDTTSESSELVDDRNSTDDTVALTAKADGNPTSSAKIVTTTYAIERGPQEDVEEACLGTRPQHFVQATKRQNGTWATTTLAADVVVALESAQIKGRGSIWFIFSVPQIGEQIFLTGSRCWTEGGHFPLVSYDLKTRTFKQLAVSNLHSAHSAWEFSSDDSRIVEAKGGVDGDRLVLIDLLSDTSTTLVTLPKGKFFASGCELGKCASPLRWIDENTIEYGIFGGPTIEYREIVGVPGTHPMTVYPKNPEEIRRVELQ